MLRNIICWMMVAITPATLIATDSGAAMLYGRGGAVWLNGIPLPRSSAVFPGDLIQTQAESLATLDAFGSGVIVFPDSQIKFGGNTVSLEHGGINVGTSRRMVALAGEVTVTPVSNAWTDFEVVDESGSVQVAATKGEVNVNCGKGSATLSEGEQATRDDSGNCHKKRKGGAPPMPGNGSIVTNPYFLAGSVIGGGVIVCLLLCQSSKPFVSQWKP